MKSSVNNSLISNFKAEAKKNAEYERKIVENNIMLDDIYKQQKDTLNNLSGSYVNFNNLKQRNYLIAMNKLLNKHNELIYNIISRIPIAHYRVIVNEVLIQKNYSKFDLSYLFNISPSTVDSIIFNQINTVVTEKDIENIKVINNKIKELEGNI